MGDFSDEARERRWREANGFEKPQGTTTRQLLDVLEMAEGPQKILYLWPNEYTISFPALLLTDLAKRAEKQRIFLMKRRTVIFPMTGATVRFDYVNQFPDRHLAGIWGSVVIDHGCMELYPKATQRWLDYLDVYAMKFQEGNKWPRAS
jgi:hypothetical protein